MALTTKKTLRITFETSGGSAYSITLPEPKEDLTGQQIEEAMDQIIAKNIFLTPGGERAAKRDIKIIDTTTNDLYDPPLA
jgi:hypothetical protein